MKWTELKVAVEQQKARDPQRARLAEMAIEGVEAGLRHLAGAGYQFEIAPKGQLAELRQQIAETSSKTLSIAEGSSLVAKPATAPDARFEAKDSAA